jgi:hypothetical protein
MIDHSARVAFHPHRRKAKAFKVAVINPEILDIRQ